MPAEDRQRSVVATLADTILLTDAAGAPLTGLDPAEGGIRRAADGFPDLPQAANGRVSIDAESLVLLPDGGFFIGDEYGPYIYRFSADRPHAGGDQAARSLHPQAQGQGSLLVEQSGSGRGRRPSRATRNAAGRTIRASRACR